MADLRVVYDSSLSPNAINVSQTFKNGRVAFITVSSLGNNQVAEIGISCIVKLPSLSGTVDKLWTELGTIFSDTAIVLPSELADLPYDFYFAMSSEDTIGGFRIYVVTEDINLTTISEQLEELLQLTKGIEITNNLTLGNQLLQNSALTILGTGLIPITAGVTSAIPPLLAPSLIPVLLP